MIGFGFPMICCMPSFYHPVVKSSVIEKTELLHNIRGFLQSGLALSCLMQKVALERDNYVCSVYM